MILYQLNFKHKKVRVFNVKNKNRKKRKIHND